MYPGECTIKILATVSTDMYSPKLQQNLDFEFDSRMNNTGFFQGLENVGKGEW